MISLSLQAPRSVIAASAGRNAISTPMRLAVTPDLRTCSAAFCMASTEPPELVLPSGVQNGATSRLVAFKAMAEERRLLRRALGVDQQRQIAADAHGVHVVEEDGAVAAQQVLDVVLGVGDQDIDAGIVHEPVEALGVEGDGWLGDVEHERCSLGVGCGA